MQTITVDLTGINSWDEFHQYFADFDRFPDYYGRNGNAWIDVMQDYIEEQGLLKIVRPDRYTTPDNNVYLSMMLDCVTFINFRKTEEGVSSFIIASYSK